MMFGRVRLVNLAYHVLVHDVWSCVIGQFGLPCVSNSKAKATADTAIQSAQTQARQAVAQATHLEVLRLSCSLYSPTVLSTNSGDTFAYAQCI